MHHYISLQKYSIHRIIRLTESWYWFSLCVLPYFLFHTPNRPLHRNLKINFWRRFITNLVWLNFVFVFNFWLLCIMITFNVSSFSHWIRDINKKKNIMTISLCHHRNDFHLSGLCRSRQRCKLTLSISTLTYYDLIIAIILSCAVSCIIPRRMW